MTHLTAQPVDPRNHAWEAWDPTYRVDFWRRRADGGWASREFEVSGGDVAAVLGWAADESHRDESFAVFVVIDRGEERGLVRLAGSDPTRP